jgi:ribosomal-protein-alanine N-acetyltransferase
MRLPDWLTRPAPAPHVAPLDTRHAETLAEIHAGAFARPWSALEFEGMLADHHVTADGLFVARKPQPAGFILSRRIGDEAEVLSVAIAPELRGRNCARPLLAAHLETLSREGVRTVHLEVEEGNVRALALYRRLGFGEIGRREGYYLKPDGSQATALTMSRSL